MNNSSITIRKTIMLIHKLLCKNIISLMTFIWMIDMNYYLKGDRTITYSWLIYPYRKLEYKYDTKILPIYDKLYLIKKTIKAMHVLRVDCQPPTSEMLNLAITPLSKCLFNGTKGLTRRHKTIECLISLFLYCWTIGERPL